MRNSLDVRADRDGKTSSQGVVRRGSGLSRNASVL